MFQTVADIGQLVKRESIDCHFEQSGGLDIAVLPQQLNRLKEEWKELCSRGFDGADYRWLDARETNEQVHVDGTLGALLLNHCAAIHPARLARGLAEVVERAGVRIYENSPVLAQKRHELTAPQGKVRAETILLTTEGYTTGWANPGRRLIPVHSMMVATEPLSGEQLESTGLTRRCTFGNGDRVVTYGQLTADGRIAFGCRGTYLFGSGIRTDFPAEDADFELVRNTLLRFFPRLKGVRFTHAWGGAMGVSRALQASVNFDTEKRLGWAGGYFGSGVAATHLAGQTLADLVTGRDTDRVHTPWVNPSGAARGWEPEPWRWLGIRYARAMMALADRLEYADGKLLTAGASLIDRLRPDL
jgi:glycine/D-amino acid oxidase-like deaminating enzyme